MLLHHGVKLELTIDARHANALILRVAYGYTAKNHGDEITAKTKEAMHTFDLVSVLTLSGLYRRTYTPRQGMQQGLDGFLVNQIPYLAKLPDWFPGTNFKRVAREWAPLYIEMIDAPLNYTRQQLVSNSMETVTT